MRTLKLTTLALSIMLVLASTTIAVEIPDNITVGEQGVKMDTFLTRLQAFGFHGTALVAHGGNTVIARIR